MEWGKESAEVRKIKAQILKYSNPPFKDPTVVKWLQDELDATIAGEKKGHLETASGKFQVQAQPKASGRPQFGPQNYPDFALTPFIAQNPMSLGGATFAPVNQKLLYPWREEEDIEKRSPIWNLMGYNV